jgi:hypothetical protein
MPFAALVRLAINEQLIVFFNINLSKFNENY